MNLLASVYNHGSEEVPAWALVTCPTEKMPEGKMWKGPGAIAIPGHRGPKLCELFVFKEWVPGENRVVLHPHEPEEGEGGFQLSPWVKADVLMSLQAAFSETYFDTITVGPVEDRDSSLPMQKLYVEGLNQQGCKVWCEFRVGLGSSVVEFNGKVEASDPGERNSRLSGSQGIDIKFNARGTHNVYFNESDSDTLVYNSPLPDGRAFPFSGYITFGHHDDTPVVDGSLDGVLFIDVKPAWDNHLPPGIPILPVYARHRGFSSDVLPVSMDQHPLTEKKYTHATGGRFAFGYGGTEVCYDPRVIRPLLRASRCECFRPIHKLEEGGDAFRRSNHPTLKTHNMSWSSQGGGDSYAFGKSNPHDTGVDRDDWDLQGGEHLSMQDSFVIACLKNCPIAIDTIERAAELQLAQVDYFKQPRHVYRTVKFLACCVQAPISDRLRLEAFNYIQDFVPRVLDYMQSSEAGRSSEPVLTGIAPFNTAPREDGHWWDVIQNGLVGSIPMALELARIPLLDERYEPYFLQVVRATLWKGLFKDSFGIWRAHWSVRDDEDEFKPANSHKAIIRQCAPGLKWLHSKSGDAEEKGRIESVLASVDDGSPDARRYLI